MFSKIMVPVDLAHVDKLGRALSVAGTLAKENGAEVVYVGVTGSHPSSVAHTPEEFTKKLEAFAAEQGAAHGQKTSSFSVHSNDPAADLDHKLSEAAEETGADLVVMATHVPQAGDFLGPNHGSALARHSHISVFLVRGG
ncbi:universal stress protein [Histidinibacterium aquaticum]|uniref:Universal stress protein n=1 Tax=Histidinibacterium aquaticum TaxID=2613962 RepID=A0A5J5GNP7_9RHOB|nr:universal stress protein [Histidinibacterium aquaticum]KAA9009770.1 universal stress protein [Histidinibacterium aquaticum]